MIEDEDEMEKCGPESTRRDTSGVEREWLMRETKRVADSKHQE